MRARVGWAVLALLGAAMPALAQAGAGSPPVDTSKGVLPIDRWVTTPTSIVLSPEQRSKFDSLRGLFALELSQLPPEARNSDLLATPAGRQLDNTYQARVRGLLTEYQKTVFDKNVAVEFAMGGKKRSPKP